MFKHSLPSIELFAAYLDGNLSHSEMRQFSQLAEHDSTLHRLLDASSVIDDTIENFTNIDLQLPSDLIGSDFELPTIPADGVSQLVTLSPEPMDDMLVAAVAYANEDVSMFSDVNQEDHLTIGGELQHDDPSRLMPEDDGFDGNDNLSVSLSDDL